MKPKKVKWIDIKSVILLLMTLALVLMLLIPGLNPAKELLSLYCTTYGAVITYSFSKKEEKEE